MLGAGDLQRGLGETNLEAALDEFVEGFPAQATVQKKSDHRLDQMPVCDFACQQ